MAAVTHTIVRAVAARAGPLPRDGVAALRIISPLIERSDDGAENEGCQEEHGDSGVGAD